MSNGSKKGQRRRSRKRRPKGNKNILKLSIAAVTIVIIAIFLSAALPDFGTMIAVICMLALGVIFYLMATSQSKPRRQNRKPRKSDSKNAEPQFYTALPSSLGLTEIPEELPKPQVKLPPRPIRAARRRRDFITYPMAVGGGSYSDSYVQVDKDTVLRLRSEMTPGPSLRMLPGKRIERFPSSKIGAVMSQEVKPSVELTEPQEIVVPASEEGPIVAEAVDAAVAVDAAPVVVSEASTSEQPAVQAAVIQEEEEEEEVEFDMEWD